MAADDDGCGFLIIGVLAVIGIIILLYLIAWAFTIVASAGALWGLGVSSKNFFVAAKQNIGQGGK